jgi:hypothetical protein
MANVVRRFLDTYLYDAGALVGDEEDFLRKLLTGSSKVIGQEVDKKKLGAVFYCS